MSAEWGSPPVEVVPAAGRAAMEAFIRLPERLMAGDSSWIAPLRQERRMALSARHNPFFRHAEAAFWLARRGGRVVGRISAQHDRLAPTAADGSAAGHFGLLAAEDDPAVFAALLGTAEAWCRARGLGHVSGPFSLSINEETGLLVQGFDTPPMLMMPHDPPYAGAHLERLGYQGEQDLLAYRVDTAPPLPAATTALVRRGLPEGIVLRPLRRDRLRQEVGLLVEIFNEAWSGNWGFVPLTPEEVDAMAAALKPLLRERLVWFAETEGRAVAFAVCLPNLNEAIRDLSGRLLPLGWAKLLWRLKAGRTTTARVPLMGVRRDYADGMLGRLLPLFIVDTLRREALAQGIQTIEMSWVLAGNRPMRRLAEAVGGEAYKTYRIYGRSLAA
ncbi:GNAT family N-acetyltransferase [Roseomonas haemaphysalidis]|uniref:GNAT family N-acetyltransferase n=1 Tax=Roseomonas haemaphysalidis TaxID=2768162 RepID=UPI001A975C19|nr:dATP pyrophosphohydrolase [Roseomonas haemaphysalidis]